MNNSMKNDKELVSIQGKITEGLMGDALVDLENYLLMHPNPSFTGRLQLLRDDYRLLADYWRRGAEDAQRGQLYDKLLRQAYELLSDLSLSNSVNHSSFLLSISKGVKHEWSVEQIRDELENYVQEAALLELLPEKERQTKSEALYQSHLQLMNELFDNIWLSMSWKENVARSFEEILLSPTIDSNDQQLLVSAITLSLHNTFCFNKFRLLTSVYERAQQEPLRQRALVGWVTTMHAEVATLYEEEKDIVHHLLMDDRCRQELKELQKQFYYCIAADEDSQKIKNEIMPNLMEGNHLKYTGKGLVETDEDQLENILHPEAEEQNMERMEESMHRMADMQKQGSDIYYAGFAQMKRFSFFNSVANWFVPFYPQHPDISRIWNHTKGNNFLHSITQMGAFCDSDKYSFVLAFDQVISQMPSSMLKMMEKGEAMPMPVGGEVAMQEQLKPAFIRRIYLQNLYRFYRLFPQRSEFTNPFSNCLFFANPLFRETPLDANRIEVAYFLLKRGLIEEALKVVKHIGDDFHDLNYYLFMGHTITLAHQYQVKESLLNGFNDSKYYFMQALRLAPDNSKALKGYARELFDEEKYEAALETFSHLLEVSPDNRGAELNAATCLIKLGRYEEALKTLFRLNYNNPDDQSINRALAWTLSLTGKYEQAVKIYDKLLSSEQKIADDYLNYGYCMWFQKDVRSAISLLRQFVSLHENGLEQLHKVLFETDNYILLNHDISTTEVRLMYDEFTN